MKTFNIDLAGVSRTLPLVQLTNGRTIAFFQLLGDVELCRHIARELVNRAGSKCDLVITPETKSIPLAHEIARLTKTPYLVVRKSCKEYMVSPLKEVTQPFTSPSNEITFWLDSRDADQIRGKELWFVDDVITTGNTARAVENLVTKIGGKITKKLIAVKEGTTVDGYADTLWLGELPIFDLKEKASSAISKTDAGEVPFHHRALDLREHWPVVYTAISKHAFCYRVLISKFVLEQKRVPINPFMNFDFGFFGLVPKDTLLTANNNAVRISDELWMFGPVSDGAYAEIVIAKELGHPIRYFAVSKSWVISELQEPDVQYESEVTHKYQHKATQ